MIKPILFSSIILLSPFSAFAGEVFSAPERTSGADQLAYIIKSTKSTVDVFMPKFKMAPGERLEPRVSFDTAKKHCRSEGFITAKMREKLLAILTVSDREIDGTVFRYECIK